MDHPLLLNLHKLYLTHHQSKAPKPLTMDILWLILFNILAAFCLFPAMASVIIWTPASTVRKHMKTSLNDDFDINSLEPYPLPPIEGKSRYKMNMGLRRMDRKNWLTIDKNYLKEHQVRSVLLSSKRNGDIQCLAGSEAACMEVLDVVVEHLTQRYPDAFRLSKSKEKQTVTITATGKAFPVTSPYAGMSPLEIAARLSMEDLNVLINHRKAAEYVLYAASFIPSNLVI